MHPIRSTIQNIRFHCRNQREEKRFEFPQWPVPADWPNVGRLASTAQQVSKKPFVEVQKIFFPWLHILLS